MLRGEAVVGDERFDTDPGRNSRCQLTFHNGTKMKLNPSLPVRLRPGRPRSASAASHEAVLDAVQELLETRPLRDLTMDAVAKRASIGKPTLYRWWPTKSALVLTMFQERLVSDGDLPTAGSAEDRIRHRVQLLIKQFNGTFGKVMADLIAEGQADHRLLRDLYDHHIGHRRASAALEIAQGIKDGEFRADLDIDLLLDQIVGPIYFLLLVRSRPLTAAYGNHLVDQVLRGTRT